MTNILLPNLPDTGLLQDVYHFSKRGSFEARKNGQPDTQYKLAMGVTLMITGAVMTLDAWNKMHGGRSR